MADEAFKLFDSDPNKPILPFASNIQKDNIEKAKDDSETQKKSVDKPDDDSSGVKPIQTGESLKSSGIDRAIRGEKVNTLMAPVEKEVIQPNYLIDLKSATLPTDFHGQVVDTLLDEDGDVAIYATTKTGIVRLGFGLADILDRILISSINALYSGECKVYKNIQPGKPLVEVKHRDAASIRLKL